MFFGGRRSITDRFCAQAKEDPTSALAVPESERQMRAKLADPQHPMFNGGLVGLLSGGKIDVGSRRAVRKVEKFERREAKHESRMERIESKTERKMDRDLRKGRDEGRIDERFERGMTKAGRREERHERKMERRCGPRVVEEDVGDHVADGPASFRRGDGYFPRDAQALGAYGGRAGRERPKGAIGAVRKVLQEDVLYLMIVPMPSEAELAEARELLQAERAK